MGWMEGLVFNSFMSVLFNGSPTNDFMVYIGIRYGDPLSPFLFLIVGKGLDGKIDKSRSIREYQGFCMDTNIHFELLQFVDDTR